MRLVWAQHALDDRETIFSYIESTDPRAAVHVDEEIVRAARNVAGGIGYEFNKTVSAVLGYRALGVDYSSDGFVFDVVQQGPILGVVMHF